MRPTQKANSKKWYEKVKKDPVRWARIMERQRAWQRKYRASQSKTYKNMTMRRRVKRRLNPFPHRERNKAYYEAMRADQVKYQTYLDRRREYYRLRMERLRKDPAAYRAYCEARMVYHRYHRIREKARQEPWD